MGGFDSLEGKPSRWQPHHNCKTSHLDKVCSRNNTKICGLQGKQDLKNGRVHKGHHHTPLCKTCVCPHRFKAYSTESTPYQEISYVQDLDLGQQNCNTVSLWEHNLRHHGEGEKKERKKAFHTNNIFSRLGFHFTSLRFTWTFTVVMVWQL